MSVESEPKKTPKKTVKPAVKVAKAGGDAGQAAQKAGQKEGTDQPVSLVDALINAQTEYWLQQVSARQFPKLLRQEWPSIYAGLGRITLRQAIDEKKVQKLAHRYALEMEVSGAILELAGEIAALVFQSPRNRKTRIRDVLSDRMFDEFLEKAFETDGVLDLATARIRESEAFRTLLTELILTVLKGSMSSDSESSPSRLARVRKGARVLRDWIGERAPDLTESIEESARRLLDGGVTSTVEVIISMLEHEHYRDAVMSGVVQWWDRVKDQPVSAAQGYLRDMDLQEFIVIGYEFWLEFRSSDYLKSMIDGGISLFYRKYGDETLQDIIGEMGLSEEALRQTLIDQASDISNILLKTGVVEHFVRGQLTGFYASDAVRAILAEHGTKS